MARHVSGAPIPRPTGWADGLCLTCRRDEVRKSGDARALIEFELRRGRRLREVSATCRVPVRRVTTVRDSLVSSGELERPERDGGVDRQQAELDTLRKLGEATATEFGKARGIGRKAASRRLGELKAVGLVTGEKGEGHAMRWRVAESEGASLTSSR